jgi:hypothetical protein
VQLVIEATDLLGLQPGDATTARWVLDCTATPTLTGLDLTGPYVQGRPGRAVRLPVVGDARCRRPIRHVPPGEVDVDAVDPAIADAAAADGRNTAPHGLTHAPGKTRFAAVRPAFVEGSA